MSHRLAWHWHHRHNRSRLWSDLWGWLTDATTVAAVVLAFYIALAGF